MQIDLSGRNARNDQRADDAGAALPGAEGVLVGDLSTLAGMRSVAEQAAGERRTTCRSGR